MAAFILNIKRINPGTLHGSGVIPKEVTTEGQVNQELARSPDNISVVMDVATEAQVRGLLQYAKAIGLGIDTTGIESEAVAALA